jgi:N-methylhydantoinase B
VALRGEDADAVASAALRAEIRAARLGRSSGEPTPIVGEHIGWIGESLQLVRAGGQSCVVTSAGAVLARGHTSWRQGAHAVTRGKPKLQLAIRLHAELAVTTWHCPISGTQLAVDIHRRDETPFDDIVLALGGGAS